ncbi:MAG: hypothetical protein NWR72_12680 [Bacteroidia bacterium]|nr:hypothetical protein [Bacteroidia bacterium]
MPSYKAQQMKKNTLFSILFLLASPSVLLAQQSIADSTTQMALLEVTYRGGIPGGDLADRFGYLSLIGIQGGVKFKNNFYLSAGLQLLFGDVVREFDVFEKILDSSGLLIGDQGLLTDYRVNAAGWMLPVTVGKIFPIFPGHNPNSGIYVEVGGQYIRHRLGFEAYDDDVTQLTGDYRKGYDRLTAGFGMRESIGYTFFDSRGYVNFSLGFDFSQNFTRGQRSIQFDTGLPNDQKRMDLLAGIRFSWIYPIYQRSPDRVYYY